MKKTTNVHPFHCEFHGTSDGFKLEFFDRTESGTERRHVIHFEFWWVRPLASLLWKAIKYRQESVTSAEKSMENQNDCT